MCGDWTPCVPGLQPLMEAGMVTWGCDPRLRWDAPLVLKSDEPSDSYQNPPKPSSQIRMDWIRCFGVSGPQAQHHPSLG